MAGGLRAAAEAHLQQQEQEGPLGAAERAAKGASSPAQRAGKPLSLRHKAEQLLWASLSRQSPDEIRACRSSAALGQHSRAWSGWDAEEQQLAHHSRDLPTQ